MKKTILGVVVATTTLLGGTLVMAPAASAGQAVPEITKENAVPYFAASVKASKKVVKVSDRAASLCDQLISATDPAEMDRLENRAQAAIYSAAWYFEVAVELFDDGDERTNTVKERAARGKAYTELVLGGAHYNEALNICDAAGVDTGVGAPG